MMVSLISSLNNTLKTRKESLSRQINNSQTAWLASIKLSMTKVRKVSHRSVRMDSIMEIMSKNDCIKEINRIL